MADQFLKVLATQPPNGIYEISTVAQGNLLVEAVDGSGGGLAPLAGVAYVDQASTVLSPNGSIGAPFTTIADAVAALELTGGTVLIAAGDYSAEVVPPISQAVPWSFVGLPLDTPSKNSPTDNFSGPLVIMPSTFEFVGGDSSTVALRSLRLNVLNADGTDRLELIDCRVFLIQAAGRPVHAQDSVLDSGGVACQEFSAKNCRVGGSDTAILTGAQANFIGCTGGPLAVQFQNPGGVINCDLTSRGALGAITNGAITPSGFGPAEALPVGAVIQSITGATTQLQVDAIVAAGVSLGFWTDDR